jgi:hypothetical protein
MPLSHFRIPNQWFSGLGSMARASPTQCLGGLCASCFLPGSTYDLDRYGDDAPLATALVIANVTGYHLEFYPPDSADGLSGALLHGVRFRFVPQFSRNFDPSQAIRKRFPRNNDGDA